MLIKRYIALVLSLLTLISLVGCLANTPPEPTEAPTQIPTEKPTERPTEVPTEKPTEEPPESITLVYPEPGPVTEDELRSIEEYLNAAENYGFVCSNYYNSASEIELLWIFRYGAGIGVEMDQWAKGEAEAVLKALGRSEFYSPTVKISKKDANALLLEKCGRSLSDWKNVSFPYVHAYDAYYITVTDKEWCYPITIEGGEIDKNGHYIIRYAFSYECPTGDMYTVTLHKTNKGYQFISNVEEYNPDPYPLHEINTKYFSIDGDKKTYNGAAFALTVPVDWLATERHWEDGTDYHFEDPTLARLGLSIYQTGAEYVYERTEEEYLAYLSQTLENVKILSYTKETLSGFDCTKVVYSYTVEGTEYIATRYDNVIRDFTLLDFHIVYPVAESAQFAPVFEDIVASIVLQPY